MMYLNPNKLECGAYPGLQSVQADGLLAFPEDFMAVFYPGDKEAAGFVDVEQDGGQVISCVWNEEAYQAWLMTRPVSEGAEEAPEPLTDAELATAILDGVNDI